MMEMQEQERCDDDMAMKKRAEKSIQTEPTVPIPSPQRLIEITHPDAPIRIGPGTQYATFTTAHLGDRFPFIDTADWLFVLHREGLAWIRSKAVSASRGLAVTKIKTSLHEGPGTQYAPVRKIAAGRRLACISLEGWYPVSIDNLVLWISAKYSREIGSNMPETGSSGHGIGSNEHETEVMANGMDHQVVD